MNIQDNNLVIVAVYHQADDPTYLYAYYDGAGDWTKELGKAAYYTQDQVNEVIDNIATAPRIPSPICQGSYPGSVLTKLLCDQGTDKLGGDGKITLRAYQVSAETCHDVPAREIVEKVYDAQQTEHYQTTANHPNFCVSSALENNVLSYTTAEALFSIGISTYAQAKAIGIRKLITGYALTDAKKVEVMLWMLGVEESV